jgi:hypothetical protein
MTASAVPARPRRERTRTPARSRRPVADTAAMREYLDSLDLSVVPTIHINGHAFANALVTVDFGQPLKPAKLSQEQGAVFSDLLRKLARDVLNREGANIRVSYDSYNGVYWASIA